MNKIKTTAFLCTMLSAAALFAFQYPGAQPNSGQSGTMPSQQTAQPSPTTPPPQQTQPAEPSQPQRSSGQMPNIDEQVSMLTSQLNLTQDQQSKIKAILVDQHEQAMNVVKDDTLSRDDKLAKIHSLRQGTISKVRQLLTDNQKPSFDQMIQQQDERIRQREQGATPSAPADSPGNASPGSTPPPAGNPPSSAKPPR